jgi:hypothetical protein
MSIDKDAEFYKLLVGCIAFFAGILNAVGVKLLSELKDNDKELFKRANEIENRMTAVETRCDEKHDNDRRKGKK